MLSGRYRSALDRKRAVEGKGGDLGGGRIIKKKKERERGATSDRRAAGRVGAWGGPGHLEADGVASFISVAGEPDAPSPPRPSFFFFSSRRRHTRYIGDWSSDVCSSD